MSAYPTKERILARPVTYRRATVRVVRAWRREFRGRRRSETAIRALILRLALVYHRPVRVEFVRGMVLGEHYDPRTQTIRLNPEHVSIITALHEVAHHLYGRSELTACRWSVWLFRRTFPASYKRLTWRGHRLVRDPVYLRELRRRLRGLEPPPNPEKP